MALKPIYKSILIVAGKITFLSFVILSMAFVNYEYKKKKPEVINVKIISNNQPAMCMVDELENDIASNFDLKNKLYSEINFSQLEKYLNEKNEIRNTAVYFTPDKQLYVLIYERKPIARIIAMNKHYYIDSDWKTFKVTASYKVPVIMGDIYENMDKFRHYPIYKFFQSENFKRFSVFDEIYLSLNCLLKDSLLNHLTDYIYINKNKEIILYPAVGKARIFVGDAEFFQEKMNKLKLFIVNGLNKNDAWNKYSEINIQYKNLVYCTKK